MTRARLAGAVMLAIVAGSAALAPIVTPHGPIQQFAGMENAPPMLPHIRGGDGRVHAPFVRPLVLADRLERRFAPTGVEQPLQWLRDGVLLSIDEANGPWLPLGGDPLGRDVLARLLYGARVSLALAAAASVGALLIGVLLGGIAGFAGGRLELALMALADFVLVLPAIYVALALRASLPLVLSAAQVFWTLVLVLSAAGWPLFARGVRAIVSSERRKEYAEAAYAAGATPLRILLRHLLPATGTFVGITATMMVPAFLITEGTLTLVGLGFPVPTATWGAMLRDAWHGAALTEAPWLMAPAATIVLTVFALHLLTDSASGTNLSQ
jgi:peptide/nickel transport system permease protein